MARGVLDEARRPRRGARLRRRARRCVGDLLGGNTGAHRQLRTGRARGGDLTDLVREIAANTPSLSRRRGAGTGAILVVVPEAGPELSVVCKSCGSEVSPYVTECPYCGTRLRKRAPKLERHGDELDPRESRRDRRRRRAAERRATSASGTAFAAASAPT